MLTVQDLVCVRGDRPLFTDANFCLQPGEALYVAGGNGAGKTSLLRLIAGLATPERGEILWDGDAIRRLREEYTAHLLYLGHAAALKDELTAVENLTISTTISGRHITPGQAVAALRQFGLKGREDLPARVLSAGQRRRVNLARLILPEPPRLWVLDEPFTALDVKAVAQLAAIIEAHLGRGGMVVYTTHQEVSLRATVQRVVIEGGKAALC
jgi:heme exporter protein A